MKLFKTLGLKRKIHHQHQLVRKTKKPALRQQDGPKRPTGANQLIHQEVCYTPTAIISISHLLDFCTQKS